MSPALAQASNTSRFFSHRGPVTGVAMVPGSTRVVTSGYDGAVGLFDLASGAVSLLGYHRHLVNQVTVDPSGRCAATCSSDYTVGLWDLDAERPERILRGHADDVEAFVFVDGSTGASASRDRRILVWDLETGAIREVLEGHEKDVLSLAAWDGRLYSSGDDMTLRVWDLASGRLVDTWGPFETETDTVAIDPLHARAVLGCDDGCIRVFDIDRGTMVREIPAHASGIKKVSVSPANGDVLSSAYDQKMLVWDRESLELKLALDKIPTTWERSLTWSPDGRRILGGTFDGTVLAWDAEAGTVELQVGREGVGDHPGNPCLNEVAADEDGTIALVSDDGIVRLGRLTAEEDRLLDRAEPASGRLLMNAVTLDAATRRVVCGAHDNRLHLFRIAGDELTDGLEVPLGEGPINSVRIAHHPGYEGEAFVACYSSAVVRVAECGEVRGRFRVHEGAVKSLRLHPSRPVGVSCGADGLLLAWSFEGELLERYVGHMAIINDVDLSPSGERLASVSRDFSVKVYDLEGGRLRHSVALGRRSLKSVCFWDETTVLVGDYWGGLVRVDLTSERSVHRTVARNGISGLARSGGRLVASSYDGAAYLVDPRELTVVGTLRLMEQRLDGEAATGNGAATAGTVLR